MLHYHRTIWLILIKIKILTNTFTNIKTENKREVKKKEKLRGKYKYLHAVLRYYWADSFFRLAISSKRDALTRIKIIGISVVK